MSGTKPSASLTPTLLARKGGAKPAMRHQFQAVMQLHDPAAESLDEDLGFNDMGDIGQAGPHEAEIVSLNPGIPVLTGKTPEVLRQQELVAASVKRPAKSRRSAIAEGRTAAFTLRLDAERHLKLRLACTLANRSAQQIVTEALDHLIAGLPDVAKLAAQAGKRR